jgi:hypothetical protein
MSTKATSTTKKKAAARAPHSNGSAKTASRKTTESVKRDAKSGEMTTKEVTLDAFRRTYDRLHPRKDK